MTVEKNTDNSKKNGKYSFLLRMNFIIPTVIISLFIIVSVYWYIGQQGHISTDDAFINAYKLSVSSKIPGRIYKLKVDEGDRVKKNQLLVVLDSTQLKANENIATSMLRLSEEDIKLANVQLALAKDNFERAKIQYRDNIIPKEKYDHTQKALEAAEALYNIDLSKIKTSKSKLAVLRTDLLNTKIYSPMDGVVAKRWVLKGDVISPGQPVFTIYNLKNIWITAELEETNLALIKVGDTAKVSVDTYPDMKFEGIVYQIGAGTASEFSPIPQSNGSGNFTKITQRIPVKITINRINNKGDIDNTGRPRLLPGMSVEIDIKEN